MINVRCWAKGQLQGWMAVCFSLGIGIMMACVSSGLIARGDPARHRGRATKKLCRRGFGRTTVASRGGSQQRSRNISVKCTAAITFGDLLFRPFNIVQEIGLAVP